jgi:molecular chaperone GrpE
MPEDGRTGFEGSAAGEPVERGEAESGDGGDGGELAAARARIDELTRAYAALVDEQRAARARTERERSRVLEAERAQVAQAILESIDELERALAAAEAEPAGTAAALAQGVRLALATLSKRVAEMGAERLALVGQPFDPRVAEAVDLVPVTDAGRDQVVVDEVRAGYRIGDRILRPARVRVGRFAQA